LPPSLGGKGHISKGFENFVFSEHAPMLKEYFLVTMGYHIGGLVTHFFES